MLPGLPGIQAVLFDVYGTLFISGAGDLGVREEAARGAAMAESLQAMGFTGARDEWGQQAAARFLELIREVHREQWAAGNAYPEVDIRDIYRDLLQELVASGRIEPPQNDWQVLRLAVEYEMRVNPAWPMPGLEETLAALRNKGIILSILSNAQFYTPLLFEALTAHDLAGWGFEEDLCIWSFKHHAAKPSPVLFRMALDRLRLTQGIGPHETLVVGNDLLNDIAPASRLGCRTALFGGDRRSYRPRTRDPRCAGIKPDLILTALNQLPSSLS